MFCCYTELIHAYTCNSPESILHVNGSGYGQLYALTVGQGGSLIFLLVHEYSSRSFLNSNPKFSRSSLVSTTICCSLLQGMAIQYRDMALNTLVYMYICLCIIMVVS